jgi:hypothetical protein
MKNHNKTTENTAPSIEIQEEYSIWEDSVLTQLLMSSEENREHITAQRREAEIVEEEMMEVPDAQDPVLAYDLYHKTLQPKLKKWLQTATPEAARRIRKQVNLLLKDGHSRGRDGKMGYLSRMQQAIAIIDKWVAFCAAGSLPPTETRIHRLFVMFQEAVGKLEVR